MLNAEAHKDALPVGMVEILFLSEMFIQNTFWNTRAEQKNFNSIMIQHIAESCYKRSKCRKILLFHSLADETPAPLVLAASVPM